MVVAASKCKLNVYNALGDAPGNLLLDGGSVNAGGTGSKMNTGLNLPLTPNTLYFLAVGCNGSVNVQGTPSVNAPSGSLVGLPDYDTSTGSGLSASWTYVANSLPNPYPAPIVYASSVTVPNVYVGP